MKELAISTLLTDCGYIPLKMVRNALGQFEIMARCADKDLNLLVDTGASSTVLDNSQADRLGVVTEKSSEKGGGLGTSEATVELATLSLSIGALEIPSLTVYFMDLGPAQQSIEKEGGSRVDGVIGADILGPGEAILAYGDASLYLKPFTPKA